MHQDLKTVQADSQESARASLKIVEPEPASKFVPKPDFAQVFSQTSAQFSQGESSKKDTKAFIKQKGISDKSDKRAVFQQTPESSEQPIFQEDQSPVQQTPLSTTVASSSVTQHSTPSIAIQNPPIKKSPPLQTSSSNPVATQADAGPEQFSPKTRPQSAQPGPAIVEALQSLERLEQTSDGSQGQKGIPSHPRTMNLLSKDKVAASKIVVGSGLIASGALLHLPVITAPVGIGMAAAGTGLVAWGGYDFYKLL